MCDIFHFKISSKQNWSDPTCSSVSYKFIFSWVYTLSYIIYFCVLGFFPALLLKAVFIQFTSFKKFYCAQLRGNNGILLYLLYLSHLLMPLLNSLRKNLKTHSV